MPIPEFADHGALPPFITGHPTISDARSPYPATMHELVDKFCVSPERAKLLKGLNEYRKLLHGGGFVSGYQWIDGSFIENVEVRLRRSPRDVDVVTLYHRPLKYQSEPRTWVTDYQAFIRKRFFDTKSIKPVFQCDTYDIDLDAGPRSLVRNSTYWFGLFTDMRGTSAKKGIVELPLAVDPMEFRSVDQAIGAKFNV